MPNQGLVQQPPPGEMIALRCGDLLEIELMLDTKEKGASFVRTNVGHATLQREAIIEEVETGRPAREEDWYDIEMKRIDETRYRLVIPLIEPGRFEAKAYFLPSKRKAPVWPRGEGNVIVNVLPATMAGGNAIYTAFVRLFGPESTLERELEETVGLLESRGFSVIPPSGKLRDLEAHLDFIIQELGFPSILLLPVFPAPTCLAERRIGPFGSPYASEDYASVDPRLAEFDQRTTPEAQFQELIDAVHARDAKLLLDLPINHTGWGSVFQRWHPEWFIRNADGSFESPGAWGVTWSDLIQLDYRHRDLWCAIADVFLWWCARGVDGFRCDAGYKIPVEVWRYVTARVRNEFPNTVFLLEGLGGEIGTTESLLDHGNLDAAYSELFQKYTRPDIEACLRGSREMHRTRGLPVHFAETHDNDRLAARSPSHARMRTALAALCSEAGAWGITCGLEWLAEEKISIYHRSSLRWGDGENQVALIRRLNAITERHPAFATDAEVSFVSRSEADVVAIRRRGACEEWPLFILANLDMSQPRRVIWTAEGISLTETPEWTDLLTSRAVIVQRDGGYYSCELAPESVLCLTPQPVDVERIDNHPSGPGRSARQQLAAKALEVIRFFNGEIPEDQAELDHLTALLYEDPLAFCREACPGNYVRVVRWRWPNDRRRLVMIPRGHVLLVECPHRFRGSLHDHDRVEGTAPSLPRADGAHFALLLPPTEPGFRTLCLTVFDEAGVMQTEAPLHVLGHWRNASVHNKFENGHTLTSEHYALCTNGRGAMAQIRAHWGSVQSQYDALLAANLHPELPVDRRVILTRCRAWLAWRGYVKELNGDCLEAFGSRCSRDACWEFQVTLCHGLTISLHVELLLEEGRNEVMVAFFRPTQELADSEETVTLIVRPDIEDRSFHAKTSAWAAEATPRPGGFTFPLSGDYLLEVDATGAEFFPEPEWLHGVPHPFDAERGLGGSSDLFSPGYFSLDLRPGQKCQLKAEVTSADVGSVDKNIRVWLPSTQIPRRTFREALCHSMEQFIVRRGRHKSIIAGYPWFLDWGRDALIATRGLIAAKRVSDVFSILEMFGELERDGTLPNAIRAEDDSDRHTSDAPLWLFVNCADLHVAGYSSHVFRTSQTGERSLFDVLESIARAYIEGTANGIAMDAGSGLIFSPSHYTWMDTNRPTATPREGYPIEIQALWFAALAYLAKIDKEEGEAWRELADRVRTSIRELYWHPERGYLSDCLHGPAGTPASKANADDHLRPNQLLVITLGALDDPKICGSVLEATAELLVPGAIRSLADRPVAYELPYVLDGRVLNDPQHPYWGAYTGSEDTSRKPAYHNGTAWTWLFPSYCEALVMTFGEEARATALHYLHSSAALFDEGCVGQLPEILDGDYPHRQRGCGAQAWAATEFYRVVSKLTRLDRTEPGRTTLSKVGVAPTTASRPGSPYSPPISPSY